MTIKLLKKGLEIELYSGTQDGQVLPMSTTLKEKFNDISQEPDERNFEYTTSPQTDYCQMLRDVINKRIKIRNFLRKNGSLVLIPGSTIPLAFSKRLYPSKLDDPYHKFILRTYKTRVITTSLHINIGINNYKELFKLLCTLRLDMPLFLALSASSCFHDGKITGFQSHRWHTFPRTPDPIPFFTSHDEYVSWMNKMLKTKKMQNVRHLWTSIRPNGPERPYKLNRIEIRICDLISNVMKELAVVSFAESLIQSYLNEENWPRLLIKNQKELNNLIKITELQEEKVAKEGLKAKIWDWRNDNEETALKVIEKVHKKLISTANKLDIVKYLNLITEILEDGNEATHFLKYFNKTKSIEKTIQHFIEEFTTNDFKTYNMIHNG